MPAYIDRDAENHIKKLINEAEEFFNLYRSRDVGTISFKYNIDKEDTHEMALSMADSFEKVAGAVSAAVADILEEVPEEAKPKEAKPEKPSEETKPAE